jgi:hypothetical protein
LSRGALPTQPTFAKSATNATASTVITCTTAAVRKLWRPMPGRPSNWKTDKRRIWMREAAGCDLTTVMTSRSLSATWALTWTFSSSCTAAREFPKMRLSPARAEADAFAIAGSVLREISFAHDLYEHFNPRGDDGEQKELSFAKAKDLPWLAASGLDLSVSSVPDDGWLKDRYKAWQEFLSGTWQEVWISGLVRKLVEAPGVDVERGVECLRTSEKKPGETKRPDFEIDVAFIRGHRLYVISCTTHAKKALCKSKLFEVALRARQMGGDLARSALVCLMPSGDNFDKLKDDIESVWDAPNQPEVFGYADLQEWQGTHGEPNPSSLKSWLDK